MTEQTQQTQEKPARRPRFISFRFRIAATITVVFSIIIVVGFIGIYNFASQRALDRLAEDLRVLLDGTAKKIDGQEFREVYTEAQPNADGFTDDPRFWDIVDWLATIKSVDGRTGLYTMFYNPDDDKVRFVASAAARTAPNDPATAHFMSVLDAYLPDEFLALFKGRGGQWLVLEPYQDDYGYWISGYESIVDSNGNAVGVLGIDYRAEYLIQVRQEILRTSIPAFAGVYIIVIAIIFIVSGRATRKIGSLVVAAEHIGEGDYDHPLPPPDHRFTDEVGILADVFRIMVAKLDKRETELRQQVAELKIEIDEAKAKAQVSEIVDTDFFASLQQKARNIRSRAQTETTEPTDDAKAVEESPPIDSQPEAHE